MNGQDQKESVLEPKVMADMPRGKVYWCPDRQIQMHESVCKQKYFKKSSRFCRVTCLQKEKNAHWPEPWASLGE